MAVHRPENKEADKQVTAVFRIPEGKRTDRKAQLCSTDQKRRVQTDRRTYRK